jgi:hypothetical protein
MTVEHHHKEDDTLIARSFKQIVEAAKTPPSRTTWLVLVVVLLVAVLIGSWFYFTSTATAASSALWLKLDQTAPDNLTKFAQESGQQGTIQARYALAKNARAEMQWVSNLGVTLPDTDGRSPREKALVHITNARDAYQRLAQESGGSDALMQESLMGAAKASEILNDLGKAKDYYKRLAGEYSASALGKEAAERVKAFDDENSKKEIEALASEFSQSK